MTNDRSEKLFSFIKHALNVWNFDLADSIYRSNYDTCDEIAKDYFWFLYETGQLNKLYVLIKNLEDVQLWWKDKMQNEDFPKFVDAILQTIKSDYRTIDINNNAHSILRKEILSCYLLNCYYETGELSVDFAVTNFMNFIMPSKIFLTKSYFIARCIDYFYATRQLSFFEKTKFYLTWLIGNNFSNTRAYDDYLNIVHDSFREKLGMVAPKKRVAILISGMLRGDYEYLLKNIENNIARPLNADVFIFSWDKVALWPGLCGGGGNWVGRLFGKLLTIAPQEVLNQVGFKKLLPQVYEKLAKEYTEKLQIFKLISHIGISIDTEENFFKELDKFPKAINLLNNNHNATENSRKYWLNTFKQLYGWGKCVQLIEAYEQERNFKYTHIVRLRPDRNYVSLDAQHLNELDDDEIASPIANYGLSDVEFYGKRDPMMRYLSFWENFVVYLEMIQKVPGGVHPNYYMWLVVNNLKAVPHKLRVMGDPPLLIPNFNNELKKDLLELKQNKEINDEKVEQFNKFFENVQSFYKPLPKSTAQQLEICIDVQGLQTAKISLDSLKQQLTSKTQQLTQTKNQLDSTKIQLNSTQKELDSTKNQLDSTQKELDSTKQQLDSKVKELDSKTKELISLPIKKQTLEIKNLEQDNLLKQIQIQEAKQDLINKQLHTKQLEKELGYESNVLKELELKNQQLIQTKNQLVSTKKQLDSANKILISNPNPSHLIQNTSCFKGKLAYLNTLTTAKDRIHNHLSYKLGQAMIENSKSLLGYIRMPYVLSYIKDKHKQEQQQYQETIKKNPNLKLPNLESYPDYKESLKEKECFTYKLGEAFIKANTAGGGGTIIQITPYLLQLCKRSA